MNAIRVRRGLIGLALLGAAGCTTTPAFEDVVGAKTAKVRFTEAHRLSAFGKVQTYTDDACQSPQVMGTIGIPRWVLLNTAPEHTTQGMIDSKVAPDTWIIERKVSVDRPLTVSYYPFTYPGAVVSHVICNVTVSFQPRADLQYEVDFDVNEKSKRCTAQVQQITIAANNQIVYEPIKATIVDPKKCDSPSE